MNSLLIRSLTKLSTNVIKSPQGSTYYCINGIKVRVSDHMSDTIDGDLAIISSLRGYIVFPLRFVTKKKITVLSNVSSVLNYIKQYAYFYNIFVPSDLRQISKSQDITRKQKDFKKYAEVKSWLTTKMCPENVSLLEQIFNLLTKDNEIVKFRSLLKQFSNFNAQQKNIWLNEYLKNITK